MVGVGGGENPAFMQQVMQVHQSAAQTTPSPIPQQAPPPPPMGQAPQQPGQFRMNASPPPAPAQQQQKPLQMPSFQPQQQPQQPQQNQVPWQAQAQMPAAAPGAEGAQNTGVVMGNMLEMMKMMSQGGGIAQQPNKPPVPPSFANSSEPVNIGGAMSEMFSSMGHLQTNNQGGQRQQTNFSQPSTFQAMGGQNTAQGRPQQQQPASNFNIQMNNSNAFMGTFNNTPNGNQQRGPQPGASSGFLTQPPPGTGGAGNGNGAQQPPAFPRPSTGTGGMGAGGSFSPTAGGGFAPPPASAPRPGQGLNQRGNNNKSKNGGGLLGSVLGSGKRA